VSELEKNAGTSGTTSSRVIAGRLILLLLVSVATVWAFAFSGGRDHAPSRAGEPAHVHGASPPGAVEHDEAADGLEQDAHAHHRAGEHDHAASGIAKSGPRGRRRPRGAGEGDHAASGTEPAANQVFRVEESANARVIGTAETRTFVLSVHAAAWLDTKGGVTAVLRNDELSGLLPGEHAFFFRATAPADGIDVRLTAKPPAPWDASTSQVRFRLDGDASGLEPGEVGWVELAARPRELLVIPSRAVLYSPEGPYVLATGADGRTVNIRRVEIGRASGGLAVVLSGLRTGEPIVVGSAFSWNAERRLQPRSGATAGATR
jgi:hypothetical protein